MATTIISATNSVRQNWDIALREGKGQVKPEATKKIIAAALQDGVVDTYEWNDANRIKFDNYAQFPQGVQAANLDQAEDLVMTLGKAKPSLGRAAYDYVRTWPEKTQAQLELAWMVAAQKIKIWANFGF